VRTYQEWIELARMCLSQSRGATTPGVAAVLRGMAEEYRQKASALDAEAEQRAALQSDPP